MVWLGQQHADVDEHGFGASDGSLMITGLVMMMMMMMMKMMRMKPEVVITRH